MTKISYISRPNCPSEPAADFASHKICAIAKVTSVKTKEIRMSNECCRVIAICCLFRSASHCFPGRDCGSTAPDSGR
ncbi:hypothetical protein RHECNPAF_2330020 [Rhizobium etli CNPAF512]|nr:hypothetical protein RHECNPAF_2330020 [Rhizobium etli CNPAF512]